MTGPRGDLNPDVGGLGPKVERPKPAPAPAPTGAPGVYRKPDGRLETNIPPPPPPYIWP